MASSRSKMAQERHREKQILRRLQVAQRKVEVRRQQIAGLVESHMIRTDNDWQSLPAVLENITKSYSYEGLFFRKQRDNLTFKKDEPQGQKVSREAVGAKKGSFHIAFFALAPGFKGRPHDHTGVNCVSAVLKGPFTEVAYKKESAELLKVDNVEVRERGSVVADFSTNALEQQFVHSVGNDSREEIAYSVHVYGATKGTNFNNYYEEASIDPSPSMKL
jgi:predicted metal-dependent enzyme (double-stranded beta helix superfamily)